MKKVLPILLAGVLILLFSFTSAAQTEITIWHMEQPPQRIDAFQKTIDEFNEQNPDIFVEQQVIDWMNAYQKSMAAIRADQAPEILFTLPDFTTSILPSGAVQPVDDIIESLDKKYGFIDSALTPYQYDGHTWAIPNYGMVHMMWYRKDLFEEAGLDPNNPPETWDELLNAVKTIDEKLDKVKGIGVPASDHMYTDQAIYSFMATAGAQVFDSDGNLAFDSPESIKTFEFYEKLVNYSPSDSTNWSWAEPQLALNNGSLAIAIEKGQFLAPFEEQSGVDASNLGGAPVPHPKGGQRSSIYYPNGMMILTEDEEKIEAVKEFLFYLFEPETNGKWLSSMDPGLFLPVTEATRKSESYWNHPVIKQYEEEVKLMIEQSNYGKLFGFNHETLNKSIGKIAGQHILAQAVQQMIVKDMSPEEAVKWGAEKMKETLE